ncbi:MotA/TolQ/ExbB proton channel family protein [Bacteroidota bacterium]
MKKLFALLAITGMLLILASNVAFAQEPEVAEEAATEQPDSTMAVEEEVAPAAAEEDSGEAETEMSLHKQVKRLFIEGGATFMGFVLLTLIFGLALAIERIIYLNLSTTNTDKLLAKIEEALGSGGVDAAKEVCRNTRGPIASIFYQGLDRAHEGIDVAEKSVIAYGSVQMGLLEKNLSWIQLFISIAPMLGFMGTVIGMIAAFDSIQIAGDVSPQLVASGIKVALITTVSGLVVAIILQIFYNYIVSRIDSIVNKMEDASITLIDLLVHHNLNK